MYNTLNIVYHFFLNFGMTVAWWWIVHVW